MTKYTARFTNKTIVSTEFKSRVEFYNWICKNQLAKKYGRLIEIVCTPYAK